jgi:hypothetical protein
MRLHEIKPTQPATPEQAKVRTLQAQADRAKQAVKAEKARQAIVKAQRQMLSTKPPTT